MDDSLLFILGCGRYFGFLTKRTRPAYRVAVVRPCFGRSAEFWDMGGGWEGGVEFWEGAGGGRAEPELAPLGLIYILLILLSLRFGFLVLRGV